MVQALENVKKELPHTRPRLRKNTYRQVLVIQKRNRDLEDQMKKQGYGRGGSTERAKKPHRLQDPRVNEILTRE